MGDLAAHWCRLGELSIADSLRESGLSDERVVEFSRNLQALEDLEEFQGKDLEEFCYKCRDYEDDALPATQAGSIEERIGGSLVHRSSTLSSQFARKRVQSYWKCLLLAVIGRGARPSKLTSISLVGDGSEISLDEDEAVALCVNLGTNNKLQSLHLQNQTAFGSQHVCNFVIKALKTNSALRRLSLPCVDMNCGSVKILMMALQSNSTLESLDIGGNSRIGDEGAAYVAQMLKANTSLKRLDLQGIGCGLEGAKAISSALGRNITLETFSFGRNPILAEGMKLLLALFIPKENAGPASWNSVLNILRESSGEIWDPKNSTIRHLGMRDMKKQDVSVEFLALMLKTNKTLMSLDISGIPLELHDWIDKIIPALKMNDNLKRLVLDKSGDLPIEPLMDLITCATTKTVLEDISLDATNMSPKAGLIHEELMINKRFRKGWRDQIRVKPRSARIVLCGFAFAGKSTICKTMRDIIQGRSYLEDCRAQVKRVIRKVPCIREIIFGGQAVRELEDRTRGCEIVQLRDDPNQGRISVWDFAGLKEYYALHDYLFPSFKNSCFLYVCSLRFPPWEVPRTGPGWLRRPGSIKSKEAIREELLYWLRFIASNSKTLPAADGRSGPLPRVILVLTNKDQVHPINLNQTARSAREVVHEMKERFKDVVVVQEEVEIVAAHSGEDVQRLFSVAEENLEQLLELSTEYAVCEEVRRVLEDCSVRKSKPVLAMAEFDRLCEKELQPNMDPIEYKAAKLDTTEGRVSVLTYLDYVGEIIYTPSLDLIVVNPRWFGMGVLGSLIDAFRGSRLKPSDWQGVIGALGSFLGSREQTFHHNHGFVREKDFKDITKNLEQHIDPEVLVQLMTELELCFKVDDTDVEETGVSGDISQTSESVSAATPLLGVMHGEQPREEHEKPKSSLLFIPAVFDDDEAPEDGRKLEWNPLLDQSGQHFQYVGRRLECENKILTFLTPGFFPRLQVYLRNYLSAQGWTQNKGFRVDRNLIGFYANGMEVLLEYSGDQDYFIDVLVKSTQPFSETVHFIQERLISRIREFCATPRGCQGVVLVEAVVRPVCVRHLHPCRERKNQAELVSLLEDRIRENGRSYQYSWREDIDGLDGLEDLDFALDLLKGKGYLDSKMRSQILEVVYQALHTTGSLEYTSAFEKDEEAVIFPRLFYPTFENAGVVLKILANIDTEISINVHFMCEDREGAHLVEDQVGRVKQVKANSNSPLLKYALSLIWFGVIRGSRDAGPSDESVDESWIDRLFCATELSTCIEDLFRIMDLSKPLMTASVDDTLDAYTRYLELEPSTEWLLDFLFLENRRDFWQDFQLWKVRYTDSNQTSWVCDEHYLTGTKWGKGTFRSVLH
ncbi:hypothetical protein MPTK1_4g08770 [Marchantia polymorpha subsp. ruderalis]|uniref:C-terminal of Roc (COR) domain-containing protein n=2 Tax=Marchantia polymorpha TaxID=3197 RepID=A0A176VGM1_MARPO|nr:hypothetical protein AXG93_2742s1010 [Marchantia polymorpha subsp. ruderalis]PTQ28670.1 hypothetical protein MARPO_0157s0002 [Marchantia polymorpha]BBN08086.1 hypothetical protein Mp_4g08770 [Marchantia polymorpha subsp. ruderalis]|eukprot:PTQ28670.1 hypothetical protein MARPO_0157s0002 [Marchantia polymorpha]